MRKNVLNLIDFLSVGEENAVTAKELSKILNWNTREVTIAVNALRKQGEIICSSGNGFYLPSDDSDVRCFIRQMNSRIADMTKAMKPAEEYLKNGGGDIC